MRGRFRVTLRQSAIPGHSQTRSAAASKTGTQGNRRRFTLYSRVYDTFPECAACSLRVPLKNLGHRVNIKRGRLPDWIVTALDIAYLDRSEENQTEAHYLTWTGTTTNESDPSQFRTLIRQPKQA
jgi:hypothetical protein